MIESRCEITPELAEALETSFCELVGCSPWSIVRLNEKSPYQLSGYFEDAAALAEAWAALREDFPTLSEQVESVEVDDCDWQNAYKAFLKPWDCHGLHWVPLWMREDYIVPKGEVAVWLDAGMAFGTGSHETTRLCAMRLLDFKEARGVEAFARACIIDAGCGSGILAISANLLGACSVYGFDRDPEAARVSVENATLNDAGEVCFEENGIEEALRGRRADLLLANIQADVLMIYAETLVEAVEARGWLALSGVLEVEREKVSTHFLNTCEGLRGVRPKLDCHTMGQWCDILLRFE